MITLILMRHGETIGNRFPRPEGRGSLIFAQNSLHPRHKWRGFFAQNKTNKIQGSGDSHVLTKKGKGQAESVGERLMSFEVDVIYCSELRRAKQTARIINKQLNKKIHFTKKLNERSFGILEGQDTKSVFAKFDRMSPYKRHSYTPRGGESIIAVEKRVYEEIKKIIEDNEGKNVLLVTHGGVIKVLIYMIKKLEWEQRADIRIENTSLTIFKLHEDEVIEELINDISHLKKELL